VARIVMKDGERADLGALAIRTPSCQVVAQAVVACVLVVCVIARNRRSHVVVAAQLDDWSCSGRRHDARCR